MKDQKKSKKPVIAIALIAVIAIAVVAVVMIKGGQLTASTMRMLRTEGVVKLFDQEKEKTITNNLRLNAGNVLNTEGASLAGIALDDTKIVTVNEFSRAQFDQKGKKLDINLTDGSLFFEVTKKLDADETFDIRTSTMVVGIRGTSGYVATDKNGNDVVVITDGQVEVTGINPVTGEVKTITVKAGEMVTTYLYNDRTVDSIMFEKAELTEDDLGNFIVARLVESERLLTMVCEDTGWSREKILGIADANGDAMYAGVTAVPGGVGGGSGDGSENGDGSGSGDAAGGAGAGDGTGDASGNGAGSGAASDNALTGAGTSGATDGASTQTAKSSKSGAAAYVVSVDSNGVMHLTTGGTFDPNYYATQNPDVVAEIGTDPYKLLEHYLAYGSSDKRYGSASEQQTADAAKQAEYQSFIDSVNRAEAEAAEAARQAAGSSGGDDDDGGSSGSYTYITNGQGNNSGTNNNPTNGNNSGGP